MPQCQLELPAGARATMAATYADGGMDYAQLVDERILSYGAVEGEQIYDWCRSSVLTVPAGAPGTLNQDLMALLTPDGSTLVGLVGKLVYLEVLMVSGADLRIRRSAANALLLLSGVVDTIDVSSGHAVLVDRRPTTTLATPAAPLLDATHKMLQFESTAGATFRLLIAVI